LTVVISGLLRRSGSAQAHLIESRYRKPIQRSSGHLRGRDLTQRPRLCELVPLFDISQPTGTEAERRPRRRVSRRGRHGTGHVVPADRLDQVAAGLTFGASIRFSQENTMRGLMGRISTFVKAKISKLLDRAEDPAETLDYAYERQLEDLQNVKKGIADVITSNKRLQL
jgi:hypothetical protein